MAVKLFVVEKFNQMSTNYIYLKHHLEARTDNNIQGEEYMRFTPNKYQAKLVQTSNNFNCLIEGLDFEISPIGEISFYDKTHHLF